MAVGTMPEVVPPALSQRPRHGIGDFAAFMLGPW